jgi:hypothetical protein
VLDQLLSNLVSSLAFLASSVITPKLALGEQEEVQDCSRGVWYISFFQSLLMLGVDYKVLNGISFSEHMRLHKILDLGFILASIEL